MGKSVSGLPINKSEVWPANQSLVANYTAAGNQRAEVASLFRNFIGRVLIGS